MRITVPETLKYFCISESSAYYLQKFVVYRKRKIFSGNRPSMIWWIWLRNTKGEILVPCTDIHKQEIFETLDAQSIDYTKASHLQDCSQWFKWLLQMWTMMFWFFQSIRNNFAFQNFPKFKQNNTRIAAFGPTTAGSIGCRFTPWYSGTGTGGSIHDYGIGAIH